MIMANNLSCFQYGLIPAAPLPDAAGRTAMTIPAPSAFDSSPALPAGEGALPAWLPIAAVVILVILLLLKLLDTAALLLIASRQKSAIILLQNCRKVQTKKHHKAANGSFARNESACMFGGIDDADEADIEVTNPAHAEQSSDPNISCNENRLEETTMNPPYRLHSSQSSQKGKSPKEQRLSLQEQGLTVQENSLTPPCLSVSVNGGIHINPYLPVTLDPDESSSSMLELYDGNLVRPKESCFCGYNSAAFFSRHDFFLIFDFVATGGLSIPAQGQIQLLSLRNPAVVRNENGHYQLVKKGVLEADEK